MVYVALPHACHCQAPFFISADYLSDGILVNGTRYPITKMSWVNGETLLKFIERNINNYSAIRAVGDQFQKMIAALESLGVAHGDLQHGNILVANDRLVLVDYDGMYVPALAGLHAEERGHVNYQHPQRNNEFGPDIDRFSALVIFLALKAITPKLWYEYSTGENLLFSQDDFRSPDTSRLFADLETVPDLRKLIQRFRVVCKNRLTSVPRLADFLRGDMPTSTSEPIKLSARRSQYKTLEATKRDELLLHAGQRVTVIGKITEHTRKQTAGYSPKPYVFLSFGDWQKGSFRLILWSEVLQLFQLQQKNTTDYNQRWVSVTGLLGKFTKEQRTHPQIIIEAPSEIELLGGEEEAKERLASSVDPETEPLSPTKSILIHRAVSEQVSQSTKSPPVPPISTTSDRISYLYRDWPVPSSPTQMEPAGVSQSALTVSKLTPLASSPKPPVVAPSPPVHRQLVQAPPDTAANLVTCPHCQAKVRRDRLEGHIEKKCPAWKEKNVLGTIKNAIALVNKKHPTPKKPK